MWTSDLDYTLPEDLIAQSPVEPRDASRLMVVDAKTGDISHHVFRDLPSLLAPGDSLVLNETKVLPARLFARRPGGGKVELLFLRGIGEAPGGAWEVLVRPGKRLRPGMDLNADGERIEVVENLSDGRWALRGRDLPGLMQRAGHMPLPPYIRQTEAAERAYQTVYAKNPGSAAAPTAGFHFTPRTLAESERAGVLISRVTLHVGTGTFTPVRTERLEDHQMHAEYYSVPDETVCAVKDANRVVAVGTTVARTLESWAASGKPEGESTLFVYPGYRWRAVDAMITNFHLPRSTLLAMIMSFAGRDLVERAYRIAVEERYRFYSFGDAMLLLNGGRNR